MISNTVALWIYYLGEDYIDPDSGKRDNLPLRQLQFATKMDFGNDQAAWRRWFEVNDFYTAYQGWLTPKVIRCLHALDGRLAPGSPDFLAPEAARRWLSNALLRNFGNNVEKWQQWIAEYGIQAYDGCYIYPVGHVLRVLLSDRLMPHPSTHMPQTPEEAHQYLVQYSDEDFDYDVRAWFEWFIENDKETAHKGHLRRLKEQEIQKAREQDDPGHSTT